MELHADLCEGRGKSGGVGAFAFAGLDRLVGDEPGVAPAAEILAASVTPAGDVRFIYVGHAGGASVERDVAGLGEVEDVFVTIVHVALRVDRLEMACGKRFATGGMGGDGFDPVERVLKDKKRIFAISEGEDELVREERVCGRGTYVQEERSVVGHHAFHLGGPGFAPGEKFVARSRVLKSRISDTEIIWRRGDDEVEGFLREGGEDLEAISV